MLTKSNLTKGRPNRRPVLDDQVLSQLQPTAALLGVSRLTPVDEAPGVLCFKERVLVILEDVEDWNRTRGLQVN